MSRAFSAGFETSVFLGRCPRLMMKPRRWRFDAARSELSAASEPLISCPPKPSGRRRINLLSTIISQLLGAEALAKETSTEFRGRASELLQKRFPA